LTEVEKVDHRKKVVVVEAASGRGRGSGYVIAPRAVLTSAHVVPEKGSRVSLFRPGQASTYTARVEWRGTPGGRDDAALLSVDGHDPWGLRDWPSVRWGRLVTRRTGTPLETWGAPDVAQRPGTAKDTLQEEGTINPGGFFVANRYVMIVTNPPQPTANGESPWGGMSGAALFSGQLLLGVIASDQEGFGHSRLGAVPVPLLWKDKGFRDALARHAPEAGPALEAVELQHLVDAAPNPAAFNFAELLNPRRAVVPFDDRTGTLAKLRDWAKAPGLGTHVLHGPSGQGKTRLGHQLAEVFSKDDWAVVWLRETLVPREADVLGHVVLPLLVVIDNADARGVGQVREVVEALAGHSNSDLPVKLLLLAETGSDAEWWQELQRRTSGSPTVTEVLDRAVFTPLPALAPVLSARKKAYQQAVEAFTRRLPRVRGQEHLGQRALAANLTDPDLDEPGLENARALHLSALTDLLTATGANPGDINTLWTSCAPKPHDPHTWKRYLAAAKTAATSHPYPQALPDHLSAPELAAVYLPQRVRPETPARGRGFARPGEDGTSPAATTLEGQDRCVVLAPAGGGKTSLLRSIMASAGRRLSEKQHGHPRAVPVFVRATDLVGRSLHTAIAESVRAELSADIPPEFFLSRPLQGVPWLVLVDGLDEVVDDEERRKVVDRLYEHAEDSSASPYRFVIATRPIPESQLTRPGKKVFRRYELMPFEHDELRPLAERWFEALQVPQPETAAESLIAKLAHTQLAELARTPLMASMLCQLHANAPKDPLPKGRSKVYQEFTNMLHSRRRTGGLPMKDDFKDGLLTNAAHNTWDHLSGLITRLAAYRHAGGTQPAVEWLAAQAEAACPLEEMRREWSQFLTQCLRRSGLLTQRGTDFIFLHQTILEYLAARHTARDEGAGDRKFADLFERRWFPSSDAYSYTGFLLDAWTEAGRNDLGTAFHRLVLGGVGGGCGFIAEQIKLGTLLPDHVTAAAAESLAAEAARGASNDTGTNAAWSAKYLVMLGDPRGREAFAELALDNDVNIRTRQWAANDLVKLNDPRGAQALYMLATHPTLEPSERALAATRLAEVDSLRARDPLAALAQNTDVPDHVRRQAAEELNNLGDPRGAEALLALVNDIELHALTRILAARALGACGDQRGFDALYAFATTLDGQALERLGSLLGRMEEDQSGGTAWKEISARLAAAYRKDAALALAELGDKRGLDVLKKTDGPTTNSDIMDAAKRLHAADQSKGLTELSALVEDPSTPDTRRRWAAATLARLGDPRGLNFLADLAEDPVAPSDLRQVAAQFLAGLYDKRGPDALASIAENDQLRRLERLEAAHFLADLCDHRGRDALTILREESDNQSENDWPPGFPDWPGTMPDWSFRMSGWYHAPEPGWTLGSLSVSVDWDTLSTEVKFQYIRDE
jgi:HEAT repeat protein